MLIIKDYHIRGVSNNERKNATEHIGIQVEYTDIDLPQPTDLKRTEKFVERHIPAPKPTPKKVLRSDVKVQKLKEFVRTTKERHLPIKKDAIKKGHSHIDLQEVVTKIRERYVSSREEASDSVEGFRVITRNR